MTAKPTMTKGELVDTIATYAGCTKEKAKDTAQAVLDKMAGNLMTGGAVRLDGVGTLSLSHVAGGAARNPLTGKDMVVEAYNRGIFRVTKLLKRPAAAGRAKAA